LIALVALVAALAGSAQALPGSRTVADDDLQAGSVPGRALQKNSVGNRKLKDGAVTDVKITDSSGITPKIADGGVTGPKIAGDAVTGPKIAGDSVTGADVDESTLGPVPSVEGVVPVARKLAFGDDVELIGNGPISVHAHCIPGDGVGASAPDPTIRLYVKTTDSGTLLNGLNTFDGSGAPPNDFVTPATSEGNAILEQQINGNPSEASTDVDGVIDNGWVVGGDGSYIGFDAEQAVLGINALGANCLVITVFTLQKA
jgi:hypothetical protein